MKLASSLIAILTLISTSASASVRIEGTIHAVDQNNNSYVIKDNSGDLHELQLTELTKVRVNRKSYKDLAMVEVGAKAIFKQTDIKAKPLKTQSPKPKQVEAVLQSVDKSKKLITFLNKESGNVQTMHYSLGKKEHKLKEGKKVILELSANSVKTITSL